VVLGLGGYALAAVIELIAVVSIFNTLLGGAHQRGRSTARRMKAVVCDRSGLSDELIER
jgi:hypothetical protein